MSLSSTHLNLKLFPPPMATDLNSNSWDSDGNILVPLYGIRIAFGLAFLTASVFVWFAFLEDKKSHEQNPGPGIGFVNPLWISILWVALPLVPFILSGLLLSMRSEQSKAAGAGIAAALFSCGLICSLAALFSVFFMFGPKVYALQEAVAALAFLGCSVWIIVAAFRIGSVSWGVFFLTSAAALICITLGVGALNTAEYRLRRQDEQRKRDAELPPFYRPVGAQETIVSLAGCLLLNHSVRPEAGFPPSLDPPPPDWPCETKFASNAVKEYTFTYIAQTGSASGVVKDFRLIAVPKQAVRGHYALMVDSRGIVFSDPNWGFSGSYIRAATSEARVSEIEELRSNIEQYMKHKALAAVPQTLDAEAVGTTYSFQVPSVENDGKRLEMKNYLVYYLTPEAGDPSRFALSVQCQSYGQNCLRSYFLDHDGVLHATGEPRQATADDPLALECESSDSPCKDVAWPKE